MRKIIAGLAVVCLCISLLTACAKNGSSEDTVSPVVGTENSAAGSAGVDLSSGPATILPRLQKAYNSQNLYAIIECFDPSITEAFWGMAKLLGLEADAVSSILPFFSQMVGAAGAVDNPSWGTVELTALDYEIENDSGTLTYNVSLSYSDGNAQSFDETVDVVLVDGTWYISATQSMSISGVMGETVVVPDQIPVATDITEADVADGLFPISNGSKYGFINISGKEIIAPFFSRVGDFVGDYCSVLYEEGTFKKWGIIDRMGNLVVDYTFEDIQTTPIDGYWAVKHNGKWGFYNVDTNESIECQYSSCQYSAEGYWSVYMDGGWGFLNPLTGASIPCQYSECGTFNAEIIAVKKGGYWGAIDKDGNTVVSFIYDEMTDFEAGLSVVKVNDGQGVIKKDGSYLIPLTKVLYLWMDQDYIFVSNKEALYSQKNQCDVYNTEGKYLSTCDICCGIFGGNAYLKIWNEALRTSNIIAIDSTGDVKRDILSEVMPYLQLGDNESPSVDFEAISDGNGISASTVSEASGGRINIEKVMNRFPQGIVASNYINDKGELIFDVWTTNLKGYYTDDYVFIYNGKMGSTYVYNEDWDLIASIDGRYYFYSNTVRYSALSGDNNNYYSLGSKEYLCYENVLDNPDNAALIVYDGFFYGLYYDGEILGSGITYNEITYDTGTELFTLKLGATTEHIRIGRDGTVNIWELRGGS